MHETPVTPAALAAVVREPAAAPVVPAVTVREPVVVPVAPAVAVRETVVEPVVPAGFTEDDNDDDDLLMEDFFSRKGKPPVAVPPKVYASAVAEPEKAVVPVVNEEPIPVVPAGFIDNGYDDDDLLVEDFFSRKGKSPLAPPPKVHAPAVAPFKHERPATAAAAVHSAKSAPSRVVTQTHGVKPETALPNKADKPLYQPLVHPHFQSEDLSTVSMRRPLSKDQGRILVYLYEVAQGCSNVDTIRKELAIDSHTVRESLLVLVTEGYLYLLDKKRDSRFNPAGFSYRMNNYLCSRYAARARRGGWDQSQDQPSDASVWRSKGSSLASQSLTLSSIMSKSKVAPAVQKESPAPAVIPAAVIKEKEAPAAEPLLSAAVGTYWEKEGVEDSLALKWCSTFGVKPDQMHQQLEWARFDLETNKRRETIKKDVISWFYDRLMITGGIYPRPANYRTTEELPAETMQHQHESDLSAQAKNVEIEFESSLRAFLADPEAPLYRELLARVNSFALEHLKAGQGSTEEIGLDALFKLHWGAMSNDPANPTVSFTLSGLGAGQADKHVVSLVAGWNLVGHCTLYPKAVHHAISPIATLIESIWGWRDGEWFSYVPNRQVNSLTTLEPGMGYWIKMKQPASWTMP